MQRSEHDEMTIRGSIVTIAEAMKVVAEIAMSTNADVGLDQQTEARLKMVRLLMQLQELHTAMVAAARAEGIEV